MNKLLEKELLDHVSSQDSTTLKPKSFIPKSVSTLTKDDCRSWQGSSDSWSITDHLDDVSSLQSDRIRLIGQRVRVAGVKEGIIRYFGPVQFAEGCWCGIELDEPIGKNDGSVQGTRYFSCGQNFGIFAPIRKVETVFSLKDSLVSYKNVEENQHSRPCSLTEQRSSDFKFPPIADKSQNSARSWSQSSNTNSSQIRNNFSVMMQHVSSSENIRKSSEDQSSQFCEETISRCSLSTTLNKHERSRDHRLLTGFSDSDPLNFNDSEQGNNDQKSNQDISSSSEDDEYNELNKEIPTIHTDKQSYELGSFYFDYHVENPLLSQSCYMFDSETFESDDDSKQDLSLDDLQQQQMSFDLGGLLKDDDDDFDGGFWADQEDSLGILTPNQMKDFTVISEQHTSKVSDLDAVTLPKTFSCDEVSELPDSEIVEDITVEYGDEILQNSSLSITNPIIPAHRPHHIYSSSYVPQTSTPVQGVCHDLSSNISKSTTLPPELHHVSLSSVCSASSSIKEREISYLLYGLQAEDCWESSDSVEVIAEDVLSSNKWTTVYRNDTHLKEIDYDKPLAPNTHESTKTYSDLRYSNYPKVSDSNFLKIKIGEASTTQLEQQVNNLIAAQTDTNKENSVCDNGKTLSGVPRDQINNILPKDDEIINPDEKYHAGTLKNMVLEAEKQEYVKNCLLTEISEKSSLPVHSKYSPSKTMCKEQELMREGMIISKEKEYSKKVRKDRVEGEPIEAVCHADEEVEYEESGLGTLTCSGEEACMKFSTYSQDSGVASDGHESERQLKAGSMTDSDFFTDGGLGTSIAESESEHSGESRPYRQNYKDFYRLTQDDVCPEHHKTTDKIRFQTEGHQDISVPFADKMDLKWEVKLTRVPEESISNSNSCCVSSPEETEKNHIEIENALKQENVDESEDMSETDKFPQAVVNMVNEKMSLADEKDKNILFETEPLTSKTNKNVENEIVTKTNRKWGKSEKSNGTSDTSMSNSEKRPKYPRKNVKSKIKEMFEKPKGREGEEEKKLVSRTIKKSRWDAVTTKIAASLDEDKSKPKKKEIKSKINTNLVAARQIVRNKSSNPNSEGLKHLVGKERSTRGRHFTKAENKAILQSQRDNVISRNDVTVCKTSKRTGDQLWTPTRSVQPEYNFDQETITRYQISSTASPSSDLSSTSFVFRTPSQRNIGKKNAVDKTISTGSITISKKKTSLRSNTSAKTYGQVTSPTEPLNRHTNHTNQALKSSKPPVTKTASLSSSRTTSYKKKEKGRQTTDHRKNQEYVQEIQRLGALCETRTKELNLLKMQLKHAILGFDSFCVIVKYLTEEVCTVSLILSNS
ncbi:uncharacterized protein LOC111087503 isoform X2 [Limulus polyphemus]|uniref:Uncharacterized protein LOC111087503 isoform X2 n=1 Tax=Limulus polyphemus TaxID=6850 RepID=A0ABM1T2D9_LIMPO|nr:uncharacterized protein LOC111087503 isoform X2 [Limulus polyphemus]